MISRLLYRVITTKYRKTTEWQTTLWTLFQPVTKPIYGTENRSFKCCINNSCINNSSTHHKHKLSRFIYTKHASPPKRPFLLSYNHFLMYQDVPYI